MTALTRICKQPSLFVTVVRRQGETLSLISCMEKPDRWVYLVNLGKTLATRRTRIYRAVSVAR